MACAISIAPDKSCMVAGKLYEKFIFSILRRGKLSETENNLLIDSIDFGGISFETGEEGQLRSIAIEMRSAALDIISGNLKLSNEYEISAIIALFSDVVALMDEYLSAKGSGQ